MLGRFEWACYMLQDCIAFLHQQRLPRMTFIPLDTIRAKPANERLRQLGGTARLAIDLITFNDRLERAFQYACGCAVFASANT